MRSTEERRLRDGARGEDGGKNEIARRFGRWAAALCVGAAALVAAPGGAQAQGIGFDGTCPLELLERTGFFERVLALTPDASLFVEAVGTDRVERDIPWRMEFVVLEEDSASNRLLLRSDSIEPICGWIEDTRRASRFEGDFLIGSEALEVRDIAGGGFAAYRGASETNRLVAKAMVRSTPERQVAETLSTAMVYQRPGGGEDSQFRATEIFNIFRIYAAREINGEDWYYVAGVSPYATNPDDPVEERPFAGWIAGVNIFAWNNSMMAYYAEGSAPFDVYLSQLALARQDSEGVFFGRPEGVFSPWGAGTASFPRFPILDSEFALERDAGQSRDGWYRIGIFGDGCLGQGQGVSAECLSGEQVVSALGEIGQIAERSRHAEILFVIDNTESIRPYIGGILEGVSQAAELIRADRLASENEASVRFAAALYGDYETFDADRLLMDFDLVADFGLRNDTTNLEILRTIALDPQAFAYFDDLGDAQEAGLAAIVNAVETATWSDDSLFRVVVWIGDEGSRFVGDTEQIGVDEVRVELLTRGVSFLALNISEPALDDGETFRQQAEALVQPVGDEQQALNGLPPLRTEGTVAPEEIDIYVSEFVQAVFISSRELPEWIRAQRGSEMDEGQEQTEVQQQPAPRTGREGPALQFFTSDDLRSFSRGVLRYTNYTEEQIQRIFQVRQLMEEGYIGYQSSPANMTFWFAMNPQDFENQLRPAIGEICRALQTRFDRRRLQTAMINISGGLSGDIWSPDQSIGRYMARVFYLPLENVGSLLDYTLDELEVRFQDPVLRREMTEAVCRSSYLVRSVVDGQRVADLNVIEWDQSSAQMVVRDPEQVTDFEWVWRSDADEPFYFVPVEYLPGGAL